MDDATTDAGDDDRPAPADTTDRSIPIDTPGVTLVLAGCGKSKQDKPAQAQHLYTSGYFSLKRQLGQIADSWYIISAEHGLLSPYRVTEPYDTRWSELPENVQTQRVNEIVADLKPLIPLVDTIIILAGSNYRTPLINDLESEPVEILAPFEDTSGFNDQMKFMAAERDRLTT